MKPLLSVYSDMNICIAVSGGKDSMALLHYFKENAGRYNITLSALNCDHGLRGETSARDSAFVKATCGEWKIPLLTFKRENAEDKSEASARKWRLQCYESALENGAGAVATAHHLNDNAETVLFNLARGGGLSGLCGICDGDKIIRPLINCTREEIDEYVLKNNVPYVEDETNFTNDYTRNRIRRLILPELEKAVPGAAGAIYRFSRLAAEDEAFIRSEMKRRGVLRYEGGAAVIKTCIERPVFARAAISAVKDYFSRKDYTLAHVDALYNLQFAGTGKRFEFLNLTAYGEDGAISICESAMSEPQPVLYKEYEDGEFGGVYLGFDGCEKDFDGRVLKFDGDRIPETAVIRTARAGDKFKKFGGGTKSLGDFFTDRKIPLRLRKIIPLIADGNEILAVCGVEISDKIKVTDRTVNGRRIFCGLKL